MKKSDEVFVDALKEATRKAFIDLFNEHSDEHFYYCTLVLIEGEGCPAISAMSDEALNTVVQKYKKEYMDDTPEDDLRKELKWSYADSPYCIYGEQYFAAVQEMTEQRDMDETDENYMQEYEFRMNSMEKVMADLDKEGIFGSGKKRKYMVVAAEVMPPEYANTERVLRLNSKENLKEWLEEAAEMEDDF
ncbi:MAG: DUF4303 domain-containing protein [Lachnospiraceae bacterium]|nr:DUF4303 domain-containing protein [Lachnospiraceae bacterium]